MTLPENLDLPAGAFNIDNNSLANWLVDTMQKTNEVIDYLAERDQCVCNIAKNDTLTWKNCDLSCPIHGANSIRFDGCLGCKPSYEKRLGPCKVHHSKPEGETDNSIGNEVPTLTKEELILKLTELQDEIDIESSHGDADDLLVRYINDTDISTAYESIKKWYA